MPNNYDMYVESKPTYFRVLWNKPYIKGYCDNEPFPGQTGMDIVSSLVVVNKPLT